MERESFSGGHQSVIMVSIWWVWQTGCGMECECGKCVDEELLELVGGFQVVGWLVGWQVQVIRSIWRSFFG